MKIYFRCDGGSQIGLGHLIRSLALADMLQPEYLPHFLIQEPAPAIISLLDGNGIAFTALSQTNNYHQEAASLVAEDIFDAGDLVVLDGYHFDTTYQQTLKAKDLLLVCIDDLQAFPFAADLIINQAGGVNPGLYQALPQTRLCLGPDFALLRAPFLVAARQERAITKVNRIFLNMGGADPQNDTCKILRELLASVPYIGVEVVTGSAFCFADQLASLAEAHSAIRVHRNLPAETMCQLMQACDAAILPPSSVSYEWCSVGGPLFLYQTAENQAAIKAFLLQEGLAWNWETLKEKLGQEAPDLIADQIQAQRKYFRGQSPQNLLRAFNRLYFGHHLVLRPAQPQDMMCLYEWANDPAVRENSFNHSPIPLEVHKIWFEKKWQDPACLFLVAQVKNKPAGMIRYDLQAGQATISYLIAREFRGKSLGVIILQKGEEALRQAHPEIKTVIGHVQATNVASTLSFEKNHYQHSQTISPFKPGALVFEKHF